MSDSILDLDRRHVWHPFTQEQTAPPPMVAVAAKGASLFTEDGRELTDLVSSWWVNLHGHAHPVIAAAVAEQAARLEQVIFADFTHAPAARLAARLAALLPGDLDRVFYSDNGSTAVEVALKVALQYFGNRGEDGRRRLLAFEGGYHGDTVGAMSVGRSSGYFRAWEGLLFPVEMAPYPVTWIGDAAIAEKEAVALAALEAALGDDVAAVIIEPLIQGASGMRMCRPEFLRGVAERVRKAGALLVFDEVMTGFGRTGAPFACIKAGVTPDMVCLSKGLTGGFLPMGATVVREPIHQAFLGESVRQAFLHGHSYTANPLGCAAGLASLDLLLGDDCRARIAAIEAIHLERLGALAKGGKIRHPRVTGTIAALDLGEGDYASSLGGKVRKAFLDRGFLLRPLGPVVYFLPPYCIEPAELHRAWDTLETAIGG
ncbi:adenosylmethionine--8-amino-7-oxononanoate transaminase [Telmatospirillum siberiense]|uniref:Adenosylmethionine-8-amino-7-oxononanoate aminotransferase n=1 Tax=Telmatospirillum siberiense TaxID=382514 RepID=A0A2N3PTR6_9PROT|nr:adenosylmethionine--8-amino-7-oxononanoate transaminase [Telmatospirillum siberiense]PKU23801.1 adenosylmethionine--8-amino-7-oxononanoate transaminase [Telmatospirillum siberiense]